MHTLGRETWRGKLKPEYLRGLAAGRGMRGTGGQILPVGEKYPAYREGYEM